jgi:hypothetical protein
MDRLALVNHLEAGIRVHGLFGCLARLGTGDVREDVDSGSASAVAPVRYGRACASRNSQPLNEVHSIGVHNFLDRFSGGVVDVQSAAVSGVLEAMRVQLKLAFAASDVLYDDLMGVKLAAEVVGYADLVLCVATLGWVQVVVERRCHGLSIFQRGCGHVV